MVLEKVGLASLMSLAIIPDSIPHVTPDSDPSADFSSQGDRVVDWSTSFLREPRNALRLRIF